MSNRHEAEGRVIHPRALAELGEEACIAALGVARDLRSGVIPAERLNMQTFCGTACCIGAHIAARLGEAEGKLFISKMNAEITRPNSWGSHLFSSAHPSDPVLATDAIERFVYDGSKTPWNA